MDADRTVFSFPETQAMRAALASALRGVRGANPLVGAAVLGADGTVVTGWHRGAGTPHAEVDAVLRARAEGMDLTAATVLVTLEPCSHTGRRGPCAEFLAAAGARRVVHAIDDPNPAAAGGAAVLRDRGVEVARGLLAAEARDLNARWLSAQHERRPFVTLKIAQSLDGRIAAADGTSRWITSAGARAHAHAIRERVDAILVGTGTALADDPRLTARDADGRPAGRQPVPVVLGERDLAPGSHLAGDPSARHLRTRDPRAALRTLRTEGIGHVLVEGGAHVAGAFLAADLVDELHLYTAPILLGDGLPAVAGLGVGTLDEACRFAPDPAGPPTPERFGPDTFQRLVPAAAPPPSSDPVRSAAEMPHAVRSLQGPGPTSDPPLTLAPASTRH